MSDTFDKFRLYASRRDRTRIHVVAAAFGGAAVGAGLANVSALFLLCIVVACTLLAIGARITVEETECAFCRKPRREVKQMVAGTSASICNECTKLSMQVLVEKSERDDDAEWIEMMLFGLPKRSPWEISSALFRASTPKDQQRLDALINRAIELDNPVALEELLRRSADAERTPREWINLGYALERQGRFREAMEALEHVAGIPEHEPWLLNNRASARVELGPCDEPTLRELLADNLRARQLIEASKPYGFERIAAVMLGAGAKLHLHLGEREAALECLKSARAFGGDEDPERLITQAKIVDLQGKKDEARALVQRAIELAHPESREANEARRLVETLGAVS